MAKRTYALSKNSTLLAMEMVGARELEAEFKEIAAANGRPERFIKNTIRRSLKRVSKPIVAHAKRLAPRSLDADGPHMADKIAVSSTLSRRQRRQQGFGAYNSLKDKRAVHLYIGAGPRGPAVLAEFGTGPRYTKSGHYTGVMPAQPFMRPAWEAGKHKLLREFSADLWVEIEKTAARARRRQMKKAGIK